MLERKTKQNVVLIGCFQETSFGDRLTSGQCPLPSNMNDYYTHWVPFHENCTLPFLLGSLKGTVAQDYRPLVFFFFMNSPHGDPGVIFTKIFCKENKLAVSGSEQILSEVQVILKSFLAFNTVVWASCIRNFHFPIFFEIMPV
jgi:hypothetical protein